MPEFNALALDESTRSISLPIGATGWFIFFLDTEVELNIETDRAVFGMGSRSGSSIASYQYSLVLRKDYAIQRDATGQYYIKVEFENADTRNLSVGKYYWDITIVTDPSLADNGFAVADESSDEVYPIHAVKQEFPTFTLLGGVPIV